MLNTGYEVVGYTASKLWRIKIIDARTQNNFKCTLIPIIMRSNNGIYLNQNGARVYYNIDNFEDLIYIEKIETLPMQFGQTF